MRKICALCITLLLVSYITTACAPRQPKTNMVQSKRKFAQYMEPEQEKDKNVIDLSEGPRLKYEANFGPKNLNFDIKIIDPY